MRSVPSLSAAFAAGSSSRKRAYSTPFLSCTLSPIYNVNYDSKASGSGRSSICADEILWEQDESSNIYTNLALGDERYKLHSDSGRVETPNNMMSLSPVNLILSRSDPIPISNMSNDQQQQQIAYSASPSTSGYPYSPFYCGSPDADGARQMSTSYDPTKSESRLFVPMVSHKPPVGNLSHHSIQNRPIRYTSPASTVDGGRSSAVMSPTTVNRLDSRLTIWYHLCMYILEVAFFFKLYSTSNIVLQNIDY